MQQSECSVDISNRGSIEPKLAQKTGEKSLQATPIGKDEITSVSPIVRKAQIADVSEFDENQDRLEGESEDKDNTKKSKKGKGAKRQASPYGLTPQKLAMFNSQEL